MIYLDANATSKLRPAARSAIKGIVDGRDLVRNPSSVHGPGRKARALLARARGHVLALAGEQAARAEVIFTSGGTESCNQMIFGFLGSVCSLGSQDGHIVSSSIEHPAVLEPLELLEKNGWGLTRVSPEPDGVVAVQAILRAVEKETALVVLMAANNETGAVQPVAEAARVLRESGFSGAIVSDMTQAVGKTDLSLADLLSAGVNAVALSGHKLGAPAGIGALLVEQDVRRVCRSFAPLLQGGPQELGLRAGTENLIGAVAFGEALKEISATLTEDLTGRAKLRERLWNHLFASDLCPLRISPSGKDLDSLEASSDCTRCLSNTLCLRFPACRGDDLVVALDLNGLAASTGSACSSGKQGISHVITAMGLSPEEAREAVRFSLDWDASELEVDAAAEIIKRTVRQVKASKQDEYRQYA